MIIDAFWSTPLGLAVTGTITLCSAIHILSNRIKDDLFERVWHSLITLTVFCAFVGGINKDPHIHGVMNVLLFLWAIRHIHEVVTKLHKARIK